MTPTLRFKKLAYYALAAVSMLIGATLLILSKGPSLLKLIALGAIWGGARFLRAASTGSLSKGAVDPQTESPQLKAARITSRVALLATCAWGVFTFWYVAHGYENPWPLYLLASLGVGWILSSAYSKVASWQR